MQYEQVTPSSEPLPPQTITSAPLPGTAQATQQAVPTTPSACVC